MVLVIKVVRPVHCTCQQPNLVGVSFSSPLSSSLGELLAQPQVCRSAGFPCPAHWMSGSLTWLLFAWLWELSLLPAVQDLQHRAGSPGVPVALSLSLSQQEEVAESCHLPREIFKRCPGCTACSGPGNSPLGDFSHEWCWRDRVFLWGSMEGPYWVLPQGFQGWRTLPDRAGVSTGLVKGRASEWMRYGHRGRTKGKGQWDLKNQYMAIMHSGGSFFPSPWQEVVA